MKRNVVVFVFFIVLVHTCVSSDQRNYARAHRRNSRRINAGNESQKPRDQPISGYENKEQKEQSTNIKEFDRIGTSDSQTENFGTSEAYQIEDSAVTDNNSHKTDELKKRRLVEVRKSKVNRNEETDDNYKRRGESESYDRSRYIPKWAVPQRRQQSKPEFLIVDMENYVYANRGEFHYSYESADGTKAYSRGELRKLDDDSKGTAVSGAFSYKGEDGEKYNLQYTADENGYRPIGDHLPTPPPIPPAIARALFHLATKPPPPERSHGYDSTYYYNDYN